MTSFMAHPCRFFYFLFLLIVSNAVSFYIDAFLTIWVENTERPEWHFYIAILVWIFFLFLFTALKYGEIFVLGYNTGTNVHKKMVKAVTDSP